MNERLLQLPDMVRTDSQQGEIGSNSVDDSVWLPLVVELRNCEVSYLNPECVESVLESTV